MAVTEVDNGEAVLNNDSLHDVWILKCASEIPRAQDLFRNMPHQGYIVMAVYFLFMCLTLAIYAEEVHFILKNFKMKTRKRATIWILAFFPVYSVSGFLGAVVPRSGTLVDMVGNAFFGTCIYQFVGLMVNYMGGPRRMWEIVGTDRQVKTNTPPCCCCCCCLPPATFTRRVYFKWCILVLQVAILRPILMFFAAVLWTNGSYYPGHISPYNGYTYIIVLNLGCTLPAMYGLYLIKNAMAPDLEKKFSITGKIASIQLTMLCTALPNLIIGALVSSGVIKCTPIFPSKALGETIYHGPLVLVMLPFSLIGRRFFHRAADGLEVADYPGEVGSSAENIQEVMTVTKDGRKELVTIKRVPVNDDGFDEVDRKAWEAGGSHSVIVGQDQVNRGEKVSYMTSM